LLPWLTFPDSSSASVCEIINANNVELVVLAGTRELTIVTGRDVILADTEVDVDRNVYFEGRQAGFITYAADGDGFRTLWWVSLTGRVVDVDPFTGEPGETNLFPDDYRNVGCDACEFWDDQVLCDAIPGPPVCGNGEVESGEQCDDGNLYDGDGCSADCKIELPTINIRFCASGLIMPMFLVLSLIGLLRLGGGRVRVR
jgi:cysteine-rich repeat protein